VTIIGKPSSKDLKERILSMSNMNKVGLQLYTLRDYFNSNDEALNTLKRVRNIGYKTVQLHISSIAPHDMKNMLDEAGLSVCGMDASLNRMRYDLDAVLEECRLFGCKYITDSYEGDGNVFADGYDGYFQIINGYEKGINQFTEIISDIGDRLKGSGCYFAYHNHSFEMIRKDGKTMLDTFYDNTKDYGILAEIDTYWIQHGGADSASLIEQYQNRVPIIHLKDMEVEIVNGQTNQLFSEVGNGNMNWKRIIQSAEKAGVEWYVVEQDKCNKDPFLSVQESYDYLKTLLTNE